MKKIHQAVDLQEAFNKNSDMFSKEDEIVKEIKTLTGFSPEKNIWRSEYWGRNLGASHWLGDYNGKKAVLKIQGVKPDLSEIYIIGEFSKQNRSRLIRPPTIHEKLPWKDHNDYEAIITEYASGGNVIIDGKIPTREKIARFLSYYCEYRKNCIPVESWLPKPEVENDWRTSLDKLIITSQKAYPNNRLRKKEDLKLAQNAYQTLSKVYKNVQLEFLHGHFSCKDLIYESKGSDRIILFSNLFWKWRFPFFDAVFAYHWFMYELANVKNISSNQVENQRAIWFEEIYKATEAFQSKQKNRLLKAAFLERAVAGFTLDSFLVDSKKPISEYLYESTKREAQSLIKELNSS